MGGRGASSGVSAKRIKYGTEYHTVYQSGNIKFVKPNDMNTTAPMETMTQGRVYVTLDANNEPKFISYYDKSNKRYKQIDISGPPHKINGAPTIPHTHIGYVHDENGTRSPTDKEKKMIDRVLTTWHNRISR